MPHFEERTPHEEDGGLEPIAIVGMSCRLPGSVDSASKLWDTLKAKRSLQTPKVPESRFNVDAYLHENLDRPGSFNVPGGYFLDGPAQQFDPTFFGITPIEAMWLDPQQRKMLEVVYEALEAAGLSLDAVAGSNTAVFVGSFTADYQQMSVREGDFRHAYAATGVDTGLISARIGHAFNLNGPTFTINTACSSSIYAIHNACNALRARDCSAAIAGGVNLVITVDQHMNTAKLGILSPTSTCHSFDASADGYGRAEGAGAIYLKRLSDAIRDGDPVRGVIRTSAVNTNGRFPGTGITHPSGAGQERVVRAAYAKAGLDPSRTAYVECHGTGTAVGDPIESRAVGKAMNDTRPKDKPLVVGAIKANIGHSEAASGIFAVMKAAMMTENAIIPGVCGLKNLNPAIHEDEWNIHVARETQPWPAGYQVRRAGVSSFGYGGTNGHVVVEAVDKMHPLYRHGRRRSETPGYYSKAALSRPFLVGFSAHDRTTLIRNITAHAAVAPDFHLPDLAYTLLARRSKFAERGFTIASEASLSESFETSSFTTGTAPRAPLAQLGYIFTGQGAQWAAMGAAAAATFPSFAATIRELDHILQRVVPEPPAWTLADALLDSKVDINMPEVAQPACTAVQIAIVDLFARWGLDPAVTVGHSSGEIGAAYAAGLVSAPEAIVAAFLRGRAVQQNAPVGSMLAVGLGAKEAEPYLATSTGSLYLACQNSAVSTTLSGTPEAVAEAKGKLTAKGIFARELKTGKAYHSPQMDHVAEAYDALLAIAVARLDADSFSWRQPRARWFSSVTGAEYTEDHVPATYWSENLRNRVRFDEAVAALAKDAEFSSQPTAMIEIGPHAALGGPFKQICQANKFENFSYIASLVRNKNSAASLLRTAGALWVQDYPVDVEEVNSIEEMSSKNSRPLLLVDLPPYQWNYETEFWAENRFSKEQRNLTHPRHDLLGSSIVGLSERSLAWRNTLRHKDLPWLADHRLGREAVFPAAAHLSVAAEALRQVCDNKGISVDSITFRDVDIKVALIIPDTDDGVEIQTRLTSVDEAWYSFAVESYSDEAGWSLHSEGTVAANFRPRGSQSPTASPVDESKLTHRVMGKRWYDAFQRVGFEYGPSFQPLSGIRSDGRQHHAAANCAVATESGLVVGESRYVLHPATIDGCLQLIIISINAGLHQEMRSGVVPIAIEELSMWGPESKDELQEAGHAVAWTDAHDGRYFNTHTRLDTAAGNTILDVTGLRCVAYEAAVPQRSSIAAARPREPYMETIWRPDLATLTTEQAVRAYPAIQSEADSIAAIVELAQHRSPIARAALLGQVDATTLEAVLGKVTPDTAVLLGDAGSEKLVAVAEQLERAVDVSEVVINGTKELDEEKEVEKQNLVLVGSGYAASATNEQLLEGVGAILADGAKAVFSLPGGAFDGFEELLRANGFGNGPELVFPLPDVTVVSATYTGSSSNGHASQQDKKIKIVSQGSSEHLAASWTEHGYAVDTTSLASFQPTTDNSTVVIHDADGTLMYTLTEATFNTLRALLTSGSPILWLTHGVNQGRTVSSAMAQGLVRAVRSELVSAKIALLDADIDESPSTVAAVALAKIESGIDTKDSGADGEFWLRDGIVNIARLLPNESLNAQFSAAQATPQEKTLEQDASLSGAFAEDGALVFKQQAVGQLAADEVRIQVDFASLNANAKRGPHVVTGTITAAGDATHQSDLAVGRKVIAFADSPFTTTATLPAHLVVPYSAEGVEPADLAAALPGMTSAVNALSCVARVQSSDHVVLLRAPEEFIAAAETLQKALGFQLSVVDEQTAHTERANVIVAHDFSPLEREFWRHAPATARFVLVDAAPEAAPDALPFLRGAAFLPTGVARLFKKHAQGLDGLLRRAVEVVREQGGAKAKVAAVSAFAEVDAEKSIEGDVVSFGYGRDLVKVQPSAPAVQFSPDAAYLLVGCLGGLGRSLTTFMTERGARDFVFLSRSGTDKPEAADLVNSLLASGARVQVIRADAANKTDVSAAVASVSATRSIRGVVHAAMVLQDGMFETMSYAQYTAATTPKVAGAQALQAAFEQQGLASILDFFVMTSSISATMGNPGQANYCAANSFLDGLAHQQRQLAEGGLPATSLVLPMILDVGVVAENAEIEVALERKAMYGVDEREMLRGFETAMLPRPSTTSPRAPPAIGDAQIVLGLEPARLADAMRASNGGKDAYWYADARFRTLRSSAESIIAAEDGSATPAGSADGDFAQALKTAQEEGGNAVLRAIAAHCARKMSSMLLIPVEAFRFEDEASVASFGLDSMIGAELRNWLFKVFGLEVSFQTLLAPRMTLMALAEAVGGRLGVI